LEGRVVYALYFVYLNCVFEVKAMVYMTNWLVELSYACKSASQMGEVLLTEGWVLVLLGRVGLWA